MIATINNNIEAIGQKLREGGYVNNPIQASEDHSILAGEYAFICGQLEDVLQRKPTVWSVIRTQTQSDKSADKQWDASPDGVNEMGFRLRMKSCEKMMSALKSLIRIAEGQALNQF